MNEFIKLRKLLMILTGILLLIVLTQINYNNLSIKENLTAYIMMFSGLCTILGLYLSNKYDLKKK